MKIICQSIGGKLRFWRGIVPTAENSNGSFCINGKQNFSNPMEKNPTGRLTGRKAFQFPSIPGIWGIALVALVILVFNMAFSLVSRNNLIQISEDYTRDLADNLNRGIFQEIVSLYPEEEFGVRWQEELWQERLNHLVRDRIEGLNLTKLKIFDAYGRIIYSTDPKIIGTLDHNNLKYQRAMEGKISSKLEKGNRVWDLPRESGPPIDMVETYLPIFDLTGAYPLQLKIVGVFEIYREVDTLNSALEKLEKVFLITVIGLVVLLGGLFTVLTVKGLRRKLIREKIKTIDQVTVGLKHRINNSLTGILTSLEVVLHDEDGYQMDEELRSVLRRCEEETRRIQQVIEKLSEVTSPIVTTYVGRVKMIDPDRSI